jgi:hypothetical protein
MLGLVQEHNRRAAALPALRRHAVGVVVAVVVVGERGGTGILVDDAAYTLGGVIAVGGGADHLGACHVAVARQACEVVIAMLVRYLDGLVSYRATVTPRLERKLRQPGSNHPTADRFDLARQLQDNRGPCEPHPREIA